MQQDAHEFFSFVINSAHAAYDKSRTVSNGSAKPMNKTNGNPNIDLCHCIMHRVFGGMLSSQIKCSSCGAISESFEPFFDISLDCPASLPDIMAAEMEAEEPNPQQLEQGPPKQKSAVNGYEAVSSKSETDINRKTDILAKTEAVTSTFSNEDEELVIIDIDDEDDEDDDDDDDEDTDEDEDVDGRKHDDTKEGEIEGSTCEDKESGTSEDDEKRDATPSPPVTRRTTRAAKRAAQLNEIAGEQKRLPQKRAAPKPKHPRKAVEDKKQKKTSFLDLPKSEATPASKPSQGSPRRNMLTRGLSFNAPPITLHSMLESFLAPETLGAAIQCERCQSKNENCSKRLRLKTLPSVLCFHIKRFKAGTSPANAQKSDQAITFPMKDLDMMKFLSPEDGKYPSGEKILYDLVGLVQHTGNIDSGHYISFIRHHGNWYRCDDVFVWRVSEVDVKNAQGYMLFYQRQ